MPTPTLSSLALIAALGADPAPSPSPTQEALYRALVVREGAPTCAALAPLSPTLVEDLVYLTENAKQPTWVGIRAAECLLTEHQEAALPVIIGWMGRTDAKGFALVALEKPDRMPIDPAIDLAPVSSTQLNLAKHFQLYTSGVVGALNKKQKNIYDISSSFPQC